MNVNKSYEIVVYDGGVGRTVKGKLIASLNSDELRRYGQSPQQLQALQHPLLPKGTPFDPEEGVWYVIQPLLAGEPLEFIYDRWIKDNGIHEIGIKEIVIIGTFKSGRTLEVINQAFVSEAVTGMSISHKAGQVNGEVTDPKNGVQYIATLADSGKSKLWGIYQASVPYDMLPLMSLSGASMYSEFTWPSSHTDKLEGYTWLVFGDLQDAGKRFTVAKELLGKPLEEDTNQGMFEFKKVGTEDDVAQLRSILNYLSCTDIEIGTKS